MKKNCNENCDLNCRMKNLLFIMKLMILTFFLGLTNLSASIITPVLASPSIKNGTKSEEGIQQPLKKEIKGKVTDAKGAPMTGATVVVKGTTVGTVTDPDGNFSLSVPSEIKSLLISFIGYESKVIQIGSQSTYSVRLEESIVGMSDVVVIGYGVQKKASVVAAISTTTNKELKARGAVTNLATAMAGQLPGVAIMERSGEPGKEDPVILIRGLSTWNGGSPLVLVDGIERRMNDVNVNEVQSVSVLKDASATAVFGVKGANGVILITTKRGELGKAKLSISFSNTIKAPSKLTGPMESFSARSWKNVAIEHEVATREDAWGYYTPQSTLLRYKKPQTEEYRYLYPNENWQDLMLKKFATDQNININVTGGTKDTKYFASVSYLHQGDILNSKGNDRGYNPEFSYNRLNFRGNLDFQLTPTTTLSSSLNGYLAQKKETMIYSNVWILHGIFRTPPDAFISQYPDGSFGRNPKDIDGSMWNPLVDLNYAGLKRSNTLFIGNDFKLDQKLDFITKGLSASGTLSFDNTFQSSGPNIRDGYDQGQVIYKYIDPSILDAKNKADSTAAVVYIPSAGGSGSTSITQGYDYLIKPWTIANEAVSNGGLLRALYYRLSLNYARSFEKHDVSALFLFSRRKVSMGGDFPSFQEDWVGRVTYAYNDKYFVEANGAYNGSEKFGPGYRFGFFPSIGAGWLLSKESFLEYDWLDKLKIRVNIGKVGNDGGIPRWGYAPSYTTGNGGNATFGNANGDITTASMLSPYTTYAEGIIANPIINWETAVKKNIGLELSIFQSKFTLDADYFQDNRRNIFMAADKRNVPIYFGAPAVPINLGETETKGFELDVVYRNRLANGLGYYIRSYVTRAKDIVIKAEDPELQPDYMKSVGFQIGQTKTQQVASVGNTWNDVYAQTGLSNNIYKLPGDYDIKDYNGDGLIDNFDNMAYGFPDSRPMNTYSTFFGLDFKNFTFMIQFYGVTNVTQAFYLNSPQARLRTEVSPLYNDYWTPEHTDAAFRSPRFLTNSYSPLGELGGYKQFDGSYLRLKTLEITYQIPEKVVKRIGASGVKLSVSGNNLYTWSEVPLDSEFGNYSWNNINAYPMLKQINFGIDVQF